MDFNTALALLKAQCQASTAPILSDGECHALLTATTGAVLWTPSTAYVYGTVVLPTVRIGHLYRAIVGGVSDTVEPTWPPYSAPNDNVGLTQPYWQNAPAVYTSGLVQDGTLTWLEAGPDSACVYDVRLATYNAWLHKAAKASADYDVAIDRDQYKRSQVAQFCLTMAQRYLPTGIA